MANGYVEPTGEDLIGDDSIDYDDPALNASPPPERKKVPSQRRETARKTASGGVDIDKAKVQPTKGFTPQPVVEVTDSRQMADYYRNGEFYRDSKNRIQMSQHPKTLIEREEERASIRVFGRGTGKGVSNTRQDAKPERDFIPPYTKLILQSAQESRQERSQIVETFGDFYLFFFGQRPPVYSFTGTLINVKNINWVADFEFYYDNYMRGTKCVENNARVIISYGGKQIEGYIIEMAMRTDAEVEMGVPVSFQVVVTKRNQTGFSDDFGIYTDAFGDETYDEDLRALLDSVAGKEGKGLSDIDTSNSYNYCGNTLNNEAPAAGPFADQGGLGGLGGLSSVA